MKKWFKILSGFLVSALLVTVFASAVLAQGPVDDGDGVRNLDGTGFGRGRRHGFVDEDGDGINDLHPNFVDEDGDGVCDVCGTEPGQGFVDQDGDGICDTYGAAPGEGYGRGRGAGRGWRAAGN